MVNKKAQMAGWKRWTLFGVICALIISVVLAGWYITSLKAENAELTKRLELKIKSIPFLNKAYEKTKYYVGYILGFKTGFWAQLKTFISQGIIGLFAGLWIYLLNLLIMTLEGGPIGSNRQKVRHKKSWLYMVGGQLWKVVLIGLAYAIIKLIPVINRFVEIITFEVFGINAFFRSFILAFYIGLGPAAIEALWKYKLRKKYYTDLMDVKYGKKIFRAASS